MSIECSICLEELTPANNLPVSSTKCGHLFHKACINDLVTQAGNCPQCRCSLVELRDISFNDPGNRRSDIFNSTIVQDMNVNELQQQRSNLEIEIHRLRAEIAAEEGVLNQLN